MSGNNKHPFHMFLEYVELQPERALRDIEFLKGSWTVCPLFNQALYYIFRGDNTLYETLARFQHTPQFWQENYEYYWKEVKRDKEKSYNKATDRCIKKFLKEMKRIEKSYE